MVAHGLVGWNNLRQTDNMAENIGIAQCKVMDGNGDNRYLFILVVFIIYDTMFFVQRVYWHRP